MLMGATGSGKTTLLECVCGLRPVTKGRIVIADCDVTRKRPAERGIGYVPQDAALFPRMSVLRHLAFPLVIRKWRAADIATRTNEIAKMLELTQLLDRFPARLSGGEMQRVALGRALAARPAALVLDEPLSALDDATRGKMHDVLRKVQATTGVTTLHVTHSREEALLLGERLFQLRDGRIELGITAQGATALPSRGGLERG